MIEPRMWQVSGDGFVPKDDQHSIIFNPKTAAMYRAQEGATVEALTTVSDVLAALRQPSQAMIDAAANAQFRTTYSHPYDQVKDASRACFLAMLDQFEKEQQL